MFSDELIQISLRAQPSVDAMPRHNDPMIETTPSANAIIAAGPFGAWLAQMRAALRGSGGTDVPCGDCVGCCVSAYHIPIRAADSAARRLIPERYLAQAGQTTVLRYLPDGTCPMFGAGKCSIYAHRPQTCRDYDCRIFAAAGIDAGSADKHVINARVRAWRFTYETPQDEQSRRAVQAAATFIKDHAESFAGGAPTAPTGIAVLAIKAYQVFLEPDTKDREPSELAKAIVVASRAFDAARD